MSTEHESSHMIRHESLYLSDGDIVLSASGSPLVTVLFRVDKVYLSRNSPIFRSMLSLPHAPFVNETYDGAPKVELSDKADDLACLLAALYDLTSLRLERNNPDTPIRMTGVMKLAMKYEVESVRTLIIRHVVADWPHTLEEWDAQQAEKNSTAKAFLDSKDKKFKGKYFDDVYPEPVAAICFALEFDVPSILPAAWYQLATTDAKIHLDYDTVYQDPSMRLYSHPCSKKARWKLLQKHAPLLMVTLFGKAKMEEYMKVAEHIIKNSALACEHSYRCEQIGLRKAREFLALYSPPADPLNGIQQVLAGNFWDIEMCDECILYKQDQLRRARYTIWEALPVDFQLPTWKYDSITDQSIQASWF